MPRRARERKLTPASRNLSLCRTLPTYNPRGCGQGKTSVAALKAAAGLPARYPAFVGSRRKAETLRRELAAEGVTEYALARIKAPAGLDFSAMTETHPFAFALAPICLAAR